MKRNTSDKPETVAGSLIPIIGEFQATVIRARPEGGWHDPEVRPWIRNQLTSAGLNRIANRAVQATGTTPAYIIGVGTITADANPNDLASSSTSSLARIRWP